ncbi:cleavage and polyadenylation specificity factor subunit 1 [Eupeodes corollae]|uniref:cleavage and polyadenylation specificity factor subunit 1 n=1 Tax=Eupeodes corollae TaxID=290404 RepID=UPI002491A5DC|nr:cleavage and polyadenylation specificity factor subunit 1 [Eupeodes corollae]
MFSLAKVTHPPTGVEYAINCRFFNSTDENLVTAGTNILKVYRIFPDVDPAIRAKNIEVLNPKMKLECLASYTLNGNVMSLERVTLSGSLRDALLISFKEAKLSVLQYDPDTFSLKTLSLHYFEEDDIKGGWTGRHFTPTVRVDPDNRCAVMLAYSKKLIVLPFRKDNSLDEIELPDVKPIKKTPTQLISRTPILASYIISLKDLDEKIDNVVDIQFLFGYYEPTLLILYEPVKTFPGRIAVRSDTCVMVAISLNIQQRVHPVIWTVTGLPFDCFRLLAIQKPIGGCLVASTNALMYLNQSVPPYGVSLNSIADNSTTFPLKPQDGVKITLDTAKFVFIDADKIVISLKGGELYVLTLCVDSMRSVRNFHFNKAAASVLTSCICVCQEEYLFLGSRLGNSLLLHFTEEDQSTVITIDDTDVEKDKEAPKKRSEDEELEVYGSGIKTSVQLRKFVFEVCDSILNAGPIGFMCVGERVEVEDETPHRLAENVADVKMEIVCSSGYGKNGALCVMVSTIFPQIITSFELQGCFEVWTVFDDPNKKAQGLADHHDFMILSQKSSTLVLETGDEINEIENSGFSVNQPTIFVGNLGNHRFIIQVTTRNVRLLQGTRLIQNVPIDVGSPMVEVSLADPYVCIRVLSGQVITLALRETKGTPRLAINKNTISTIPAVVSISALKDVSGLFTSKCEDVMNLTGSGSSLYGSGFGYMKAEPNMKTEDEEEMLYGESGNALKMKNLADLAKKSRSKNSDWWRRLLTQSKPSYWLLVSRDNGNLEIYSMPDLKLMYLITNVGNGADVLTDSMEFVPMPLNNQGESSKAGILLNCMPQNLNVPVPIEIMIVPLGNQGNRPLLLIRTRLEIMIYQVFRYMKGHLKIRFKKIHTINQVDNTEKMIEDVEDHDPFHLHDEYVNKMHYFTNISGLNGVAVSGINPCFMFLTIKGELRVHKLYGNATNKSFAPFNNINCPGGFLFFDNSFNLKIAVLPNYLTFDAPWPIRKVPLRCTPRQIVYHRENRVYCVVTQTEEVTNKYYRFNGEDKELTEENKGERYIYPTRSKFSVVLISPNTWEMVPDASIDLEEWEHVTAFKIVSLAYEGTRSGLKEYLSIGTNFNYSEDITSRGNIYIYDIIEVVPEPGKPLTKFKLKEVFKKEQKGPVSAIADVLGFLITALGQKIYLWQLKDDDLIGVAFIDTHIYVHRIICVKSLILIADVYKSISILRFQDEYRTLSLVSRDLQPLEVYDIEFVVDSTNLGFFVTDADENFIVYMYQPESRESFGGQKLIRKADFHLGQKVNTMFRVQCHQKGPHQRHPFFFENKHMIVFGTLDGGIGYCLPLPEKTYRRLLMLQNVLLTHKEHLAGLNPKEFRTLKSSRKLTTNPCRCIVDGELIWSYFSLPHTEKQEVAKKIGTKLEDLYLELLDVDRVTNIF